MAVLLGGRAAESLIFDHVSTGAADDLVKVTDIARSMVVKYAMVSDLGHVALDTEPPTFLGVISPEARRPYSEDTAQKVDRAVRALCQSAFDRARSVLSDNRALLAEAAAALLAKETLSEGDLAGFFARVKKPEARATSSGVEEPS